MRLFVSALLLVLAGCGRVHTLGDGTYAFTVTNVLRDDCGLNAPGVVTTAKLTTTGNVVNLRFEKPDTVLIGTYRASVEELVADGTVANLGAVVQGTECLVDVVTLHLDGVTVDANTFRGAMSIVYDTRAKDACNCRFWFDYEARRAP